MTDAELAILSIVAEAPISGMDIQAVIDQRNMRAWTMIGVESVYYVIEKMEKQGLIERVHKQFSIDSVRQQFRITAAGVGILQTAVTDMLSSSRNTPQSFELGLSNLHVLKTSQVRHALLSYRNNLQTRLEALSTKVRILLSKTTPPFHIVSMFEHQAMLIKAEIAWFDEWMPRWEEQAPDDPIEEPRIISTDVPKMQRRIMPDDPESVHKRPTRAHQLSKDELREDPQATTKLTKPTQFIKPEKDS